MKFMSFVLQLNEAIKVNTTVSDKAVDFIQGFIKKARMVDGQEKLKFITIEKNGIKILVTRKESDTGFTAQIMSREPNTTSLKKVNLMAPIKKTINEASPLSLTKNAINNIKKISDIRKLIEPGPVKVFAYFTKDIQEELKSVKKKEEVIDPQEQFLDKLSTIVDVLEYDNIHQMAINLKSNCIIFDFEPDEITISENKKITNMDQFKGTFDQPDKLLFINYNSNKNQAFRSKIEKLLKSNNDPKFDKQFFDPIKDKMNEMITSFNDGKYHHLEIYIVKYKY